MATQTVIPMLTGMPHQAAAAPHQATATRAVKPSLSDRYPHLRRSVVLLAFFAAVATAEALIPKYRFLLYQLPYFAVPGLISVAFNYLRDVHPGRVPSILARDSALRLKLQRIRNALGLTAFATTLLGFAALALASNSCTCEDHPVLFIAWLATMATSFLGCVGLSAYIRERSELPASPSRRSASSGNWSAARSRAIDSKPLHSDHWGQPAQR
jgi:hypothetical protein